MDSTIVIPEDTTATMNNPGSLTKTGLGERLRIARERMRLTEKEAAARLHLNVKMIFLIENENFREGPPLAFIRGYVRSYAKLLNLSESEITLTLKELESVMPSTEATPPRIHLPPKKQHERYFHWLTYVIILILGVLVSVWWRSHSRYVIADIPPPVQPIVASAQNLTQPEAATKQAPPITPAPGGITPAAPILPASASLSSPAPLEQAAIPQKTLETTTSAGPVTQLPTVAAAAPSVKSAKKPVISRMEMALPEPGMDNENNND